MALHAGIDTGGTFTDLVVLDDETGQIVVGKQPSTPSAPAEAIFRCLRGGRRRARLARVGDARHDGRHERAARAQGRTRPATHDGGLRGRDRRSGGSTRRTPTTCTGRSRSRSSRGADCLGVRERLAPDGSVVTPLVEEELERVAARVADVLAEADGDVAHRREPALRLRRTRATSSASPRSSSERFPGVPVSVSHRAAPVWREHERTTTTIVDAYLGPVMRRLAGELESGLTARGFSGPVSIMKSNGGRMLAAATGAQAVQTVLSGLSGGIVAGRHFGLAAGARDVVTFDMGGTSADIGLVRDGEIQYVPDFELEFGLPIATPAIDLVTIGAGGGSIAWVDDGGLLRVGPRSAGAVPGPACYGLGGTEPTVTDANLVLGRIDPGSFLGGRLRLDPTRAHEALAGARRAARPRRGRGRRGGDRDRERGDGGHDPPRRGRARRRSARLRARRLRRRRPAPCGRDRRLARDGGRDRAAAPGARLGVRHAARRPAGRPPLDALLALRRRRRRRTRRPPRGDGARRARGARRGGLRRRARRSCGRSACATPARTTSATSRCPPGRLDERALAAALDAFHALHHEVYGYSFPGETIELIHANVAALGPGARPAPASLPEGAAAGTARDARGAVRRHEPLATPVYRRERASRRPRCFAAQR